MPCKYFFFKANSNIDANKHIDISVNKQTINTTEKQAFQFVEMELIRSQKPNKAVFCSLFIIVQKNQSPKCQRNRKKKVKMNKLKM